MDPIGLALENYDAIGRWRTDDGGVPVDPDAGLIHPLRDYGPVTGRVALGEALVENPDRFARTVAEKLLTYSLGRRLEYYDMPAVREITRQAARNQYRFSSFIMGVVGSVPFQMRVSDRARPRAAAQSVSPVNGACLMPSEWQSVALYSRREKLARCHENLLRNRRPHH